MYPNEYKCTNEETLKTTTNMTLTKLSTFTAHWEFNAPDVIQSKITLVSFSTGIISRKTNQLMSAPIVTIDVETIVAASSPIDRYISPEIKDPNKGPKIKNSINLQPFIVFASSIKIEFLSL